MVKVAGFVLLHVFTRKYEVRAQPWHTSAAGLTHCGRRVWARAADSLPAASEPTQPAVRVVVVNERLPSFGGGEGKTAMERR